MLTQKAIDKAAPMPSAPMKYNEDGSVAWGEMWESFCVLAQEGGPPHRETMLRGRNDVDRTRPTYAAAVAEIVRGIEEVSGLEAAEACTGWIGIYCPQAGQARWLAEAIVTENVEARVEGETLLVPVRDDYALKGEIKNVITAVAKTTHYWEAHLPAEVKRAVAWQVWLGVVKARVKGWFGGG